MNCVNRETHMNCELMCMRSNNEVKKRMTAETRATTTAAAIVIDVKLLFFLTTHRSELAGLNKFLHNTTRYIGFESLTATPQYE